MFSIVVVIPHLAFAYLFYLFFYEFGLLARLLPQIFHTTIFVNDPYGLAIILNLLLKELPFVYLYLLSTHSEIETKLSKISFDLGSSFLETFRKVYLPIKKEQLKTLAIILFAFTIGNFEIPYILGANHPKMISVQAFENFQSLDSSLNILSKVQTILIFVTGLIFSFIIRKIKK